MAEDINILRIQYAAYRKKMQQDPKNADKILSFAQWRKQKKGE